MGTARCRTRSPLWRRTRCDGIAIGEINPWIGKSADRIQFGSDLDRNINCLDRTTSRSHLLILNRNVSIVSLYVTNLLPKRSYDSGDSLSLCLCTERSRRPD